MKNATLLVILGKTAKPASLEALANVARERALHLRVLILGSMPPIPAYVYGMGGFGGYSMPPHWQTRVNSVNAELEDTRKQVADFLTKQGTSAEVGVLSGELIDLADSMALRALTCDLIVIGDDLRLDEYLFDAILHAALFKAPAGVLLNGMKSAALMPKSVFVAWKEGWGSARAVRMALPILRAAADVTVAIFDPSKSSAQGGENSGSDVASWLSHHGCTVTVKQYPTGGDEVGTTLIKRAKEEGADLVVMGAYGHSRMREALFGGTTRTMVEQTEQAVLLCH